MLSPIIYGLFDPSDSSHEIRYVGYTGTGDAEWRLTGHLNHTRRRLAHNLRSNHLDHWLRNLLKKGLRPGTIVIEEVTQETWKERERYWIAYYPNLVNSTTGGEGLVNPSKEVRERIRAKVKAHWRNGVYSRTHAGVPHTVASKAKISAGLRASEKAQAEYARKKGSRPITNGVEQKWLMVGKRLPRGWWFGVTKEISEKIRQAKLGKPNPQTPEWSAKIAAGHVGLKQSPETIAKRAKTLIGNQRGLGNVMSDAAKDAIRRSKIGSRFIVNGSQRKLLKAGEALPDGWNFTKPKQRTKSWRQTTT